MDSIESIAKKLKTELKVAVICHVRPDGDAIGSASALTACLNDMGISASAFCDDVIPKKFAFLVENNFFKRELTEGFTAYVSVDCAELTRMGEKNATVFAKQKNTFNIDHHISNSLFAKNNFVFDNASNCENVLKLIEELGCPISERIASFLLMGIMTDTGNFKHKNVKPETLQSASMLLGFGADINTIHYNMFTKQSKERAKLFGMVMSSLRYFLDDSLAIGTVTKKMLEDSGALFEDTEGFIDFIMGIDTVKVGICITEVGKNLYKCSFRSKGTDVNKIAGVFGGGGHVLASGCQIQGEYEEIIDKLRYTVSQYIED